MTPADGISTLATTYTPLATPTSAKVGNASPDRIRETAREFEATLLAMVLKEMRQTLESDGGLFPGDSGDVQGGLFDLYLGRHLADTGGVGLASFLTQQTSSSANPDAQRTPVASGLSGTPRN